jgi:hypothetical protein
MIQLINMQIFVFGLPSPLKSLKIHLAEIKYHLLWKKRHLCLAKNPLIYAIYGMSTKMLKCVSENRNIVAGGHGGPRSFQRGEGFHHWGSVFKGGFHYYFCFQMVVVGLRDSILKMR